jgi:hypothetical protein
VLATSPPRHIRVLANEMLATNLGLALGLPMPRVEVIEVSASLIEQTEDLPNALVALERQEPFVNQTLGYQALAMLARLFRYGRLSYHGGFVNLCTGRTASLPIDSVLWQRMRVQSTEPKSAQNTQRK